MSLAITTTPNTSDTSTSLTINYTGAQFGGGQRLSMALRINSTSVQTSTFTPTSSSGSVVFTPNDVRTSIWENAHGNRLTGAVTVRGTNTTSAGVIISSATSASGTLTINTRLSNVTNGGANVNLDNNSYIKGSWTNPNTTYFRGYYEVLLGSTFVGGAGGQNTYYDYNVNPGTAWHTNMVSAIGSATSATLTYRVFTQFFTDNGWTIQGGSVGSYTGTATKIQNFAGSLTSFNNFTVLPNVSIVYGGNAGGGNSITYMLELSIDGVPRVSRANLSSIGTSFTLTSEEVGSIYTALAGASSKTATLTLKTYASGSEIGSNSRTATATNVLASITSFTNTERAGTSLSYAWATDIAISSLDYQVNGGVWVNILSGLTASSGNFTISGLAPSTSHSVIIRVTHPTSLQNTNSSALVVSTINTSIISNQPDFEIKAGGTIVVTLSKVVSVMMHNIILRSKNESVTYQTLSNVADGGTITLTTNTLNALYALTPNTTSIELTLVCESFLSGVSQGVTKKTIVGTVVDSNPTLVSATYSDINPTIQAILGDNQRILQGKSSLRVLASTMAAVNSATLSTLVVTAGQQSYSVAISGTTLASRELIVGAIFADDLTSVLVKVIDSRGFSSNDVEVPIQFIKYQEPHYLKFELERLNNYYADAFFKATYEVNSVITNNQKNVPAIAYRHKLRSASEWGAWVPVVNSTPTTIGDKLRYVVNVFAGSTFDMNQVYSVEARISDTFTTTPIVGTSFIPKGMGHLEFYEDYVNFGVQPYYTDFESNLLQVFHEGNHEALSETSLLKVDEEVTVGLTGHNYTSINEAILYFSKKVQRLKESGIPYQVARASIKLMPGYVLNEQVLVNNLDLSYITINSDVGQITILRSALTTPLSNEFPNDYPAFGGVDHAILPIINAYFVMNTSGSAAGKHGIMVANHSEVTIRASKGVANAGANGIYAINNSNVSAHGAIVHTSGNCGVLSSHSSSVSAQNVNAGACVVFGFAVEDGGTINARGASGTYNQPTNAIRPNGIIYTNLDGSSFRQPTIFKKKASDPDPDQMENGDLLIIHSEPLAFTSTNFPQEFGTGFVWGQIGAWPEDFLYWTSMASTSNSVVESFEASMFKGANYPSSIFDNNFHFSSGYFIPVYASPATIIVRFKGSISFNSFTLWGWGQDHEALNSPKSFAFFGSNDGHTWIPLYDTKAFTNTHKTSATASMNNSGLQFEYLKMVFRTNQADNNASVATLICVQELRFSVSGVRYV